MVTIPNLTMNDHTRQALHRSADRICDSWPLAIVDINAHGYPKARVYDTASVLTGDTTVEAVALAPTPPAFTWLDRLAALLAYYDLVRIHRRLMHTRIHRGQLAENAINATISLANHAAILWPDPPKPGTTTRGGHTIDEPCGLCQLPAPGGHNLAGQLLVRRIDGVPFHTIALPGQHNACYWQVWRQRRRVTA